MEPAPDLETPAKASPLWPKYGARLERDSAAEALAKRVEAASRANPDGERSTARSRKHAPDPPSDPLTDFITSRQGKALQRRDRAWRLRDSESASSASDVGSPFCAPTRPLLASAVILQGRGE